MGDTGIVMLQEYQILLRVDAQKDWWKELWKSNLASGVGTRDCGSGWFLCFECWNCPFLSHLGQLIGLRDKSLTRGRMKSIALPAVGSVCLVVFSERSRTDVETRYSHSRPQEVGGRRRGVAPSWCGVDGKAMTGQGKVLQRARELRKEAEAVGRIEQRKLGHRKWKCVKDVRGTCPEKSDNSQGPGPGTPKALGCQECQLEKDVHGPGRSRRQSLSLTKEQNEPPGTCLRKIWKMRATKCWMWIKTSRTSATRRRRLRS